VAFPPPQGPPQEPSDGKVDAYTRVVNGKIVKVNGYGTKPSTSTKAAQKVRMRPGRPRMMGTPGTYTSGRDLPRVRAFKPAPPPPQFDPMGAPLLHPSGRPMTPEEAKKHQKEQKEQMKKEKPGGFPNGN
jgi:hypothetical protein